MILNWPALKTDGKKMEPPQATREFMYTPAVGYEACDFRLNFSSISSNETTHVQHAEAAKLSFHTTGTVESWQMHCQRIMSSHSDRASEHAHSFFRQKVQGQCRCGILEDYLRRLHAVCGWGKSAEPSLGWTFLKQAAHCNFLKSKVVPMYGTQGMFWTSGSIISYLGGNLWQP